MRELSLRQEPDLRKELALLARGCDFVLPSRFKKRLRAFQQGQAGVECVSVTSRQRPLVFVCFTSRYLALLRILFIQGHF